MMNEHLKLLELAVNNALPDTIDEETGLPLNIVRELVGIHPSTAFKLVRKYGLKRLPRLAPKVRYRT